VKRYDRRRRGGNVGPDAVGIQARREGGKTRRGSFPRFPPRGISTATLPPLARVGRREGGPTETAEVLVAGRMASREDFFQEVKG
jgi:hypothetical protein